MCGIFGFVTTSNSTFGQSQMGSLLDWLFRLSETRGKDASGVCLFGDENLTIIKRPQRALNLIHSKDYRQQIDQFQTNRAALNGSTQVSGFIGHARMVTNGSEERHANNQPVIKDNAIGLLNGIVVNDADLWEEFPTLQRSYEVDTEVILSLVQHFRTSEQLPLPEAFRQTFRLLKGGNSVAVMTNDRSGLMLGTSNGSLYYAFSASCNELVFASEKYILQQTLSHQSIKHLFAPSAMMQLRPGYGMAVRFDEPLGSKLFRMEQTESLSDDLPLSPKTHPILDIGADQGIQSIPPSTNILTRTEIGNNDKFINQVNQAVAHLRRCTRCLLPETFPYISFDTDGVCSYCHNYAPMSPKGRDVLEELVAPYRRNDDIPNCLVPLSGGRDSSFGIHYVKRELGLNPIAYTYDWGMVTDLARRNISRMCGTLGVEHILISADIRAKRQNVRKNVMAWLRRPRLGTVPLFMAGDKQFFYFASLLKKQMNLGIVLFNMNPLERTDFKVGFTGINENYGKEKHYNLSAINKARLALYYGKEYALNPAYLNSTLVDTAFAFFSYYLIPKDYHTLYDYLPWSEDAVEQILIPEYEWEIAGDTTTTWRIGDGTAAFYNYIYYIMAGFSENDTLRSNQIREGMISRQEALAFVHQENQPRYESLQWYCDTIGLDLHRVLRIINQAKKLYPLS